MIKDIQEVIDYLNENMTDPVPKYILSKEIYANTSLEIEYNNLKETKWYKQLSDEQWENGSWGRFHTQDTKNQKKQKFVTTEVAIRRTKELSLDKTDGMIFRVIQLMERYISGQEKWLDINEKFYGFEIAFKSIIAANLSLYDPQNSIIQQKKEICARNLSKALVHGILDEDIWENENRKSNEILLKPYTIYIIWLLQNNDYLSERDERNFIEYIWHRKEGIYYRTNCPSSAIEYLESKNFLTWLTSLEDLSDFSLFSEFMSMGTTSHLLNEIHRLIYNDIVLPNTNPIFGHYSESWSKKQSRKNDMILRLLRVLLKTQRY